MMRGSRAGRSRLARGPGGNTATRKTEGVNMTTRLDDLLKEARARDAAFAAHFHAQGLDDLEGGAAVRRVLELAAVELERRGWCQGSLADDAGRVCVSGAIGAAVAGDPTGDRIPWDDTRAPKLISAAGEVLTRAALLELENDDERAPDGRMPAPYWNDHFCRDAAQAVAFVRGSVELVK
jgi:hypothetical protein